MRHEEYGERRRRSRYVCGLFRLSGPCVEEKDEVKEYLQYLVSFLLFNLSEQMSGGKLNQLSLFGAHHVSLSTLRLSIFLV